MAETSGVIECRFFDGETYPYVCIYDYVKDNTHLGYDIKATKTIGAAGIPHLPIYAPCKLQIWSVKYSSASLGLAESAWGEYIFAKMLDGVLPGKYLLMAHLEEGSKIFPLNSIVEAGQKIATVYKSGNSTGHIVHVEVWENDNDSRNKRVEIKKNTNYISQIVGQSAELNVYLWFKNTYRLGTGSGGTDPGGGTGPQYFDDAAARAEYEAALQRKNNAETQRNAKAGEKKVAEKYRQQAMAAKSNAEGSKGKALELIENAKGQIKASNMKYGECATDAIKSI